MICFIHISLSAPFDLALVFLLIMIMFIILYWNENYGDKNANVKQSFHIAWNSIMNGLLLLFLSQNIIIPKAGGLMLSVVYYFRSQGIAIRIDSIVI